MIVIDEKDISKQQEEVLLDLIYEATGQRIPLSKIKFGLPDSVDPRKDLDLDHNTFISAYVDPSYDSRYWKDGSGFLYRRRVISEHTLDVDFSNVQPLTLPFNITDVLDQINTRMLYPIHQNDIVDYEYKSLEDVVQKGIHLKANPHSLLWIGGMHIHVNVSKIDGNDPLISNINIDGFNEWHPTA